MPNRRALTSLLLGLVAVAALPATVAVAEGTDLLELPQASAAIPVAGLGGLAAVVLARGARERVRRTLGRVGGERSARVGRALGILGFCLALAALIAIAYYQYLVGTE